MGSQSLIMIYGIAWYHVNYEFSLAGFIITAAWQLKDNSPALIILKLT
jgi:hypothetical protein